MNLIEMLLENKEDKPECPECLERIKEIVQNELLQDEIQEFGHFLWDVYFEDSEDSEDSEEPEEDLEDLEDEYTVHDIMYFLKEIEAQEYSDILEYLQEYEDLEEGVSGRMLSKNKNHKKRKFMALSKADLRRQKAKRKRKNRMLKSKRKRYRRINKKKLQRYAKSRNAAIKNGTHVVKKRRRA